MHWVLCTDIPFDDWIEVTFRLAGDSDELTIPVVVGQQGQELFILGFSVIEQILKKHNDDPVGVSENIIRQSFPSVHYSKWEHFSILFAQKLRMPLARL